MIKGTMIDLKPLEEKDIEMIREWRNKYKEHFFDAGEISKDQQRQWYEKYRDSAGKDYMFIIQFKEGTPIGTIALYNIAIAERIAELGRVLLLEEFRGHGYAEMAVKMVLELAFEKIKLWKVKVSAHWDNLDALAIYARAGFKTTTRPIILLECMNHTIDWKKPVVIEDYDTTS